MSNKASILANQGSIVGRQHGDEVGGYGLAITAEVADHAVACLLQAPNATRFVDAATQAAAVAAQKSQY
jgi:hypothetical protein